MSKRLPRVPRIEQLTLTENEAKQLIAASKGTRIHAFVALALYTGARRGELLGLTWLFVDLDASRITIAHSLSDDGTLASQSANAPHARLSCRLRLSPPYVPTKRRKPRAN